MSLIGAPQGTPIPQGNAHLRYVLRHADDNLVVAQRLGEWISRGPELEEDIALANIALDHLGVARALLTHAGALGGGARSEDDFAMGRSEREFTNLLLVEQPNGDFAHTMTRQVLLDAYQLELWEALSGSVDETLAGIAAKALKEARYHVRHSSTWMIRLGDGTEESRRRMEEALAILWRFTGELFDGDDTDSDMVAAGIGVDPATLRPGWEMRIGEVLAEARLEAPGGTSQRVGGRQGYHTEHLGKLIAEMQWLARAMPEATW